MAVYREIDIFRIKVPYYNAYNNDKKDVNRLSKSILTQGLIYPVIVKKIVGVNEYLLIAGYKRLKAFQQLAHKFDFKYRKIPCLIEEINDQDISKIQLAESVFADKKSNFEKAVLIKRILKNNDFDYLKTTKEIGKSINYIRKMEKYFKSIERIKNVTSKEFSNNISNFNIDKIIAINKIEDNEWLEIFVIEIIKNDLSLNMIKTLVRIVNSGDVPQTITLNLEALASAINSGKPKPKTSKKSKTRSKKNESKNINNSQNCQKIKHLLNEIKEWCSNPNEMYHVSLLFTEIDSLLDDVKDYDLSR